jgi:hypothetical protein
MGDAGPYAGMMRRRWWKENGPRLGWTAFDVVRVTLWRGALCFVIMPAVMVATLWALAVGFGVTSTQETVQEFYTFADAAIRPAPPGFVQVQTCAEPAPVPTSLPPPSNKYGSLGCNRYTTTDVPVAERVAQTTDEIMLFYWVMVGLSAFWVFGTFIARRFDDGIWNVRRWIARARYVLGGRDGIPPL